jgi:hypothetical protein
MGREGEGRGGGYYDGECLFDDDRDDVEYDDDNKYYNAEDGRGHAEEQIMGVIQLQWLQHCLWAVLWWCGVEDVDHWSPCHCHCHPRR